MLSHIFQKHITINDKNIWQAYLLESIVVWASKSISLGLAERLCELLVATEYLLKNNNVDSWRR